VGKFKQIIAEGTPVVMFDRIADDVDCDKVVVDDFESAVHAMQHLLATGAKKIALLSSIDNLSVGKLRAKGYYDALKKNGVKQDDALVLITDNADDFDTRFRALIDEQKIDGVFALDEHASVSAMKQALKKGYKIPEDLQLIGFADGVWSRRLNPSLSTVSQHGPEIGEAATKLLIDRLEYRGEDEEPFRTTVIKTELRQRESTRKL
ncbi:MAG: LacI family transcriptional regulator, partial [Chitinophagaceae bacterium]